MTTETVRDEVAAFFARWGGAGLKLPTGWFGRPYDNFHELSSIEAVGGTLVVVLDDRLTLRVRNPRTATADGPVLRVEGFDDAEWIWYECDTDAEHRERYDEGAVEFVAE